MLVLFLRKFSTCHRGGYCLFQRKWLASENTDGSTWYNGREIFSVHFLFQKDFIRLELNPRDKSMVIIILKATNPSLYFFRWNILELGENDSLESYISNVSKKIMEINWLSMFFINITLYLKKKNINHFLMRK